MRKEEFTTRYKEIREAAEIADTSGQDLADARSFTVERHQRKELSREVDGHLQLLVMQLIAENQLTIEQIEALGRVVHFHPTEEWTDRDPWTFEIMNPFEGVFSEASAEEVKFMTTLMGAGRYKIQAVYTGYYPIMVDREE